MREIKQNADKTEKRDGRQRKRERREGGTTGGEVKRNNEGGAEEADAEARRVSNNGK